MKLNRVAITGMGAMCGLGNNLNEIWPSLLEGKSGISHIESYDVEKFTSKIAGEVKNYQVPEDILSAKEVGRYDRFIHFALLATFEAYKDSGLTANDYAAHKMGSILGVGMGGFPIIEKDNRTLFERGPRRVSPFFIPAIIPNMATGLITIKLGLKGVNYTTASACASGTHAIGNAAMEIMLGRQDVVVTGGAEGVLCGLPLASFNKMKAFAAPTEDPTKASRPFDRDRTGFVIGEGAGILVLENYDKALARGAKIYAEVAGFGASSDAHHITAPHPEGEGAIGCIAQAIATANITADQLGHVNAHGTSTPLGDVAEIKALKSICGDSAKNLQITSTKSMTGHLLGAAGGIESVFTAMALKDEMIPPTINVDNLDPEIDLHIVTKTAEKLKGEYALNNSFGFGGTNASLILKKV